jgi:hypothetical protein
MTAALLPAGSLTHIARSHVCVSTARTYVPRRVGDRLAVNSDYPRLRCRLRFPNLADPIRFDPSIRVLSRLAGQPTKEARRCCCLEGTKLSRSAANCPDDDLVPRVRPQPPPNTANAAGEHTVELHREYTHLNVRVKAGLCGSSLTSPNFRGRQASRTYRRYFSLAYYQLSDLSAWSGRSVISRRPLRTDEIFSRDYVRIRPDESAISPSPLPPSLSLSFRDTQLTLACLEFR